MSRKKKIIFIIVVFILILIGLFSLLSYFIRQKISYNIESGITEKQMNDIASILKARRELSRQSSE